MSKKGDSYLFELIKSLTAQEKIELKKHGLFADKNSPYTRVYNALDRMIVYSDEELLRLSKAKAGRLPEIKNYLFKQIVRVLAYVHGNHISEIRDFQAVSQILVLGYKGFFDLALKKLNEAIEEFAAAENYLNILWLVQLRDEIHFRFKPQGNMAEYAAKAFSFYSKWVKELYELSYYKYGFFSATLPLTRFQVKETKGDFMELFNGISGLEIPNEPNTPLKQIFLMSMQSRQALKFRDFKLAKDLSEAGLSYMADKKLPAIPNYLIFGLYYVKIASCMYIDAYNEGMSALDVVEKLLLENNEPYENTINGAYHGINKISYLNILGKHEDALNEAGYFKEHNKVLLKEFLTLTNNWNYNMAYAYFSLGNYKMALRYIYQFTQSPKEKVARMDFMEMILLLEIIILIEQRELILAGGKIRAYQRTLKANGTYSGFSKKVFQFVKKYLVSEHTNEFYKNQLEVLYDNSDPKEVMFFRRFFDLKLWLMRKAKYK